MAAPGEAAAPSSARAILGWDGNWLRARPRVVGMGFPWHPCWDQSCLTPSWMVCRRGLSLPSANWGDMCWVGIGSAEGPGQAGCMCQSHEVQRVKGLALHCSSRGNGVWHSVLWARWQWLVTGWAQWPPRYFPTSVILWFSNNWTAVEGRGVALWVLFYSSTKMPRSMEGKRKISQQWGWIVGILMSMVRVMFSLDPLGWYPPNKGSEGCRHSVQHGNSSIPPREMIAPVSSNTEGPEEPSGAACLAAVSGLLSLCLLPTRGSCAAWAHGPEQEAGFRKVLPDPLLLCSPFQAHPEWPSGAWGTQGIDPFLPRLYTLPTRGGMFAILLLEEANEAHRVKVALLNRSYKFDVVFCSNPAHINATSLNSGSSFCSTGHHNTA